MQELPTQSTDPLQHPDRFRQPDTHPLSLHSETTKPPEIRAHFLKMSNKELIAYLQEFCPEITQVIWDQLYILDEPAIEIQLRNPPAEKPQHEIAVTHLNYELEMVKLILAYQEFVDQFVFGEDASPISFGEFDIAQPDLIRRLVFLIMLSDVGKAGFRPLIPGESSPILQIYTHVVMDPIRHGRWLKTHQPGQLPAELQPALAFTEQSDLNPQIFGAGNFGLAPIRLALYCAEQVFMDEFPDQEEYRSYFQPSQQMEADLESLGMNLDSTLMKDFWTAAHLLSGEGLFMSEAVDDQDKAAALLSLLHHYSQGVIPPGARKLDLNDPRAIKVISLTEFLDKADANCHRSNITSVEVLKKLTENMVIPGILHHNGQDEEMPEVVTYRETLTFLSRTKIFEALIEDHEPS